MENQPINVGIKAGKAKPSLAIAVLIAMLAGAGYVAFSWYYFYWNASDRKDSDMAYLWQWKMYATGMKQAYVEDTYGGATPEETLKLFVYALKAGDIELASKYYVPEKQKEALLDFEKGKLNGSLFRTAEIYSKAAFPKQTTSEEYFMTVQYEQYSFDFIFKKNIISNKWKIIQP